MGASDAFRVRTGRATVVGGTREAPLAFEVATTPLDVRDSTGAGDAFAAGFLVAWLESAPDMRNRPSALRRAVLSGNRAAARQLTSAPRELSLG